MKRGQAVDSNIFNQLDQKKKEILASGGDVINLSIGTPDFAPDEHVMQAVAEACRNPENYKYAMEDTPGLVSAVQDWYERRYGVSLAPDQLMTVGGSQEGLAHVAFPFAGHGDLVLAPDPGYPIFSFGPLMTGAEAGLYPLLPENDWIVNLDSIDPAVADRAAAMVVSYPNNPTTAVAGMDFYERLVHFAKKHDIIIIHDNAYSDIIYGGREGKSFLSYEGAKETGIEFYSLSKSYNMTGMRISFALGNRQVIEQFRKVRSQIDYGTFLPIQMAAAAALKGPQEAVREQCREYERRNRALCGGLRSIGWEVPDSQGTMFVWAPLPKGYEKSGEFVLELMERTGVITVPGTAFGDLGEGYVRMALVQDVPAMEEIVGVIKKSGIIV